MNFMFVSVPNKTKLPEVFILWKAHMNINDLLSKSWVFSQPLKPSMGRLPVLHQVSPTLDFMGQESMSGRSYRSLKSGESADKSKRIKREHSKIIRKITFYKRARKSSSEKDISSTIFHSDYPYCLQDYCSDR